MNIHNDLSGKCWIEAHPPQIPKGFHEDVPRRLYIHFKRGSLIIGARTQAWLPKIGYLQSRWAWWPIVWRPTRKGTDA